jgi:hypothetical protein
LSMFSISAYAQLNLPNPLIEPISRQNAAKAAAAGPSVPGMPPLPGGSSGSRVQSSAGSLSESQDGSKDSILTAARSQFSGFSVAAIIGKKAVLRRQATQGSTGAPGVSQMVGGQIPMASQGASPAGSTGYKSDSLTVKDGESFDYTVGSGMLYASVSGERVVIYLNNGEGKSAGRKDVVFAGEMQSTIAQPRTITLQTKDADYRQALNIKVSGATSTSSSDSNSGPGMNGGNSQPGSQQGNQ